MTLSEKLSIDLTIALRPIVAALRTKRAALVDGPDSGFGFVLSAGRSRPRPSHR
jgi:hypothetical protein